MFTLAETRAADRGRGREEDESELVYGSSKVSPAAAAAAAAAAAGTAAGAAAGSSSSSSSLVSLSLSSAAAEGEAAAAMLDSLDASDTAAVSAAAAAVQSAAKYLNNNNRVYLHTTLGCIGIELYWHHAPLACINFYLLSKRGYYNDCLFFRIIKDHWLQTGDPTATGKGGTSIYGKPFKDEIHPGLRHTGAGVLSMASSGRDSNGSMFLCLLGPAPSLDGCSSVFARVYEGLQTLKKLSFVQTTKTGRPVHPIKIIRAETTHTNLVLQ